MQTHSTTDTRYLMTLLGPEALADLAGPVSDAEAALIDGWLNRHDGFDEIVADLIPPKQPRRSRTSERREAIAEGLGYRRYRTRRQGGVR